MLNVNKKKIKAYGDRLDDGVVQLSFTFPVAASPEAKEAAKHYAEKLGLEKVSIATMEKMGENFTFFVAYGHSGHSIDLTKIHVPKVDIPSFDFGSLKEFMAINLEKPVTVIGAAIGSDAHTVGIDAIMNMKGFAGDYGIERYPLFKAYNLRSQITAGHLIDKAVELSADVILISQVVTQRDAHVKNLKEFLKIAKADGRLSKKTIFIVGGPRIEHSLALKLGFDAGFGHGTKPSQVASFIVTEFMKRHGMKQRVMEEKKPVEVRPVAPVAIVALEGEPVSEPGEQKIPDAHPKAQGEKHQGHGFRRFRRRGRRGGKKRHFEKS